MSERIDKKWQEWLGIAANIAILIGIVLVIWELQQNQTLVRAQLSSEGSALRMELMTSLLEPDASAVLAKACMQHDELSTQDKMLLGRIFQSRLVIAYRNRSNELIANLGISYEANFQQAFRAIFSYDYGKEYYTLIKESLGEDVIQIAETELSNLQEVDCTKGPAFYSAF